MILKSNQCKCALYPSKLMVLAAQVSLKNIYFLLYFVFRHFLYILPLFVWISFWILPLFFWIYYKSFFPRTRKHMQISTSITEVVVLLQFFKSLNKNKYLIYFPQRGRERNREPETSMREKQQPVASCTPPTGFGPPTYAHAFHRN